MPARRDALRLGGVFALYFAAARLGLSAPFTSGNVSPVWPAAGAALASVLLYGYRVWPAIAAAAFLVNWLTPMPALAALGPAVGNTSEALFAAFLIRRVAGAETSLSRLRDILAFVAFGVFAGPLPAATIGTATFYAFHLSPWADSWTAWRVWMLGDGLGVALAAPLLLTWRGLRGASAAWPEAAALALLTTATGLAAFGPFTIGPAGHGVPALACFPFVVWAALRFRVFGAAAASFLIAALAAGGTLAGHGPFTGYGAGANTQLMQFFLAVVSITGLILAGAVAERTAARDAMRELSSRLLHLQDEERRRIARELHDGTGQNLTALKMSLASARSLAGKSDAKLEQMLKHSMEATDSVVREIRTMSYLLHPPLLDEAGLASAVRWYAEGLGERSGVRVSLDFAAELPRLPQALEIAVFRIVQECLTNVVRHSGSRAAKIRIEIEGGRVRLAVRDEGRGIPASLCDGASGIGIRGMRERVRELGGVFSIRPEDPGTLVEVDLPLER